MKKAELWNAQDRRAYEKLHGQLEMLESEAWIDAVL